MQNALSYTLRLRRVWRSWELAACQQHLEQMFHFRQRLVVWITKSVNPPWVPEKAHFPLLLCPVNRWVSHRLPFLISNTRALCQERARREDGGLEWTRRFPRIQAHGQHMPKANFIHQSCLVKRGDLQDSKHRTAPQQFLLPYKGLRVSRMLWEPSRGDLHPGRVLPSGVAAGSL